MERLLPAVLLVASALAGPAAARVVLPDRETVEIRAVDLGHGIHVLEGFGGTIGVSAGPDGVILNEEMGAAGALIAEHPLADLDPTWAGDVVGEADVLAMVHASLTRPR